MFLTKVEGEITSNGGRIDISSDFVNFNNKTRNNIYKNVLVKRNENYCW